MSIPQATENALKEAGLPFSADVPLAKRTYWRAGGLADGFCQVSKLADLQTLLTICTRTGCPYFVLGNGSNLLISDHGMRGFVIQLTGELTHSTASKDTPPILTVGAGLKLNVLLSRAGKQGWTGIECFAGIPGTVGGAVRMNAGATLGETQDCLLDVTIVLPNGSTQTLALDALNMSYRTTEMPKGAVVAYARLQTTGDDPNSSQEAIRKHMDHRKRTQPLHLPSCGSTFRNPTGDYAGRLIEAADLKGFQIGNAQISPKHANFIVNLGGASADDIRGVLEHAQSTVQRRFGVTLVQEVHFVGDWSHWTPKTTSP